MSSEAAIKKDIQKLQRAIVDGLEDVKAQDIQVFDTELLSPLFERVIVASGSSNRQTKALASSVRDAVREAGFTKPRIEGEDNGEWIIVDCGAAVAHIMQPAIRQYYRLEEIWGEKPLKIKLGAPAPAARKPAKPADAADGPKKSGARKSAGTPATKKPASRRPAAAGSAAAKPAPAKSAASKSAPARTAKPAAAKPAAKRTPAAKSAPAKAVPAKKAPARKAPATRASATKAAAAPATARKAAAKKAPAKKAAPRA